MEPLAWKRHISLVIRSTRTQRWLEHVVLTELLLPSRTGKYEVGGQLDVSATDGEEGVMVRNME